MSRYSWQDTFPLPEADGHKYHRGVALVIAAEEMTGATRLVAESAARIGAGLVKVLCSSQNYDLYRGALPAHIIVQKCRTIEDITAVALDGKSSAVALGSGGESFVDMRELQQKLLKSDISVVSDAQAIKVWKDGLDALAGYKAAPNLIFTPHEGEFNDLYAQIGAGAKKERTKKAAQLSEAIIVHKGRQTIIAGPHGRVERHDNSAPYLATGGTGDVLTGMIAGLCAQGMPRFEACCAAVDIHALAGQALGIGMVASDLPGKLPETLRALFPTQEAK